MSSILNAGINVNEGKVGKEIADTVKRYNRLISDRENWQSLWQDMTELVMPRKDYIFDETKGNRRHYRVFDAHQIHARQLLTAAMHSRLTNPAFQWFGLTTGNPEWDSNDDIRGQLQKITAQIHEILNNSNFQTQVAEFYDDLIGLGTGVFAVEEDDEDHVRFRTTPIWDHVIDVNKSRVVDTVFTAYEFTGRQILQKFGEKPFITSEDKTLLEAIKRDPQHKRKVVHAIYPSSDYNFISQKKMGSQKAFKSFQILTEGSVLLQEGGFDSNPFIVARYRVNSNELYGRSPGMEVYPDISMLQQMKRVQITSAQQSVNPPVLVDDQDVLGEIDLRPNAIMFKRPGTEGLKYLETAGDHGLTFEMISQVHNSIDKAFFVDQLQLIERGPAMTATEVDTRNQERMSLLAPVLARQHNEFLKPLIERVMQILIKRGVIEAPSLPTELSEENQSVNALNVRYTSQIARAQKRSLLVGLQNFYELAAPAIQFDEDARDTLDADEFLRHTADILDLPSHLLRKKEKVAQRREQKAQMVQQQQAEQQEMMEAERMQAMGKTSKDASQAVQALGQTSGAPQEVMQGGQL